ncbi:MAG: gliding motility protein GldC [Saprospirales bacterium]|nr:MAG: gliding motility protein GldC [Saprospirales bacterium]
MSEDKKKVIKKSKIEVEVGLNEDQVPTSMKWRAEDNPEAQDWQESKGMLVSFFDKESRDTFRIDLWTTEMQVMEMDRMVFHTLKGLSESYAKATGNSELAGQMQQFALYFGEKTEVIKPKKEGN